MFGLLEYIFVSLSLVLVIAVYFPVVHNQIVSRATRLEHHSLYWGTAVVSNIFTYGLLFATGRAWSINFIMVDIQLRNTSLILLISIFIMVCIQQVVVYVILFASALIASLRSSDDNYIPTPKGMAKVFINISFCWSCFCCCVCCSPRCRAKTMKVLILYSFMGFIYHTIMDAISILFIKFLDLSIAFFVVIYISLLVCFLFFVSYLLFLAFQRGKLPVGWQFVTCVGSTCLLSALFCAITLVVAMYMILYTFLTPSGLTRILAGLLPSVGISVASWYIKKKLLNTRQSSSKTPAAIQLEYGTTSEPVNDGEEDSAGGTGDGDEYQKLMP